jgi:hypothetical protein
MFAAWLFDGNIEPVVIKLTTHKAVKPNRRMMSLTHGLTDFGSSSSCSILSPLVHLASGATLGDTTRHLVAQIKAAAPSSTS